MPCSGIDGSLGPTWPSESCSSIALHRFSGFLHLPSRVQAGTKRIGFRATRVMTIRGGNTVEPRRSDRAWHSFWVLLCRAEAGHGPWPMTWHMAGWLSRETARGEARLGPAQCGLDDRTSAKQVSPEACGTSCRRELEMMQHSHKDTHLADTSGVQGDAAVQYNR